MIDLKISERKLKKMYKLYNYFYEIYGDEETIWNLEDLDEMRKLGQDFMNLFAVNFDKLHT